MSAGSSVVTLCNRALGKVGTRSTITSLTESSKEALNCSIFYNPNRQMLLRSAHWNFARAQASLTLIGQSDLNTSLYPWRYMYAIPADSLKIRYILAPPPQSDSTLVVTGDPLAWNPWFMPSRNNRFILGQNAGVEVILTNIPNAIAVYTRDETNVGLFDPGFEGALVNALALDLVNPLAGNVGMRQTFQQEAIMAVNSARVSDGNEGLSSTDHEPDWIVTRGIGPMWAPWGAPTLGIWWNSWDNLAWGS